MIILLISPVPVLIGLSVCHLAVDANLSFESFRVILIVVYRSLLSVTSSFMLVSLSDDCFMNDDS